MMLKLSMLIAAIASASAFGQSFPRFVVVDYDSPITPSLALYCFQNTTPQFPSTNMVLVGAISSVQASNAFPVLITEPIMFYAVMSSNNVGTNFSDVLPVAPPGQGRLRLGR